MNDESFFEIAQKVASKFDAKNFQQSPNLVTLAETEITHLFRLKATCPLWLFELIWIKIILETVFLCYSIFMQVQRSIYLAPILMTMWSHWRDVLTQNGIMASPHPYQSCSEWPIRFWTPSRVQGQHYLSRMTGLQSRAFGFSYLEATDLLTVTRQLTLQNYAIKVK